MDTILVTGAGGFLGRYLCSKFLKAHNVIGVELLGIKPVLGVQWKAVRSDDDLAFLVRKSYPDVVIHAAFINSKPPHLTDTQYLNHILAVNLPLFEALSLIRGKLLLISSSVVYGKAEGRDLIDERCPLRPLTLYGIAKMFQEAAACYYSTLGLKVCIARPFN